MSTRTFNADYKRGKALGETPYGMQRAAQHVASATLAARMRILHFAVIALRYPPRGQKRAWRKN